MMTRDKKAPTRLANKLTPSMVRLQKRFSLKKSQKGSQKLHTTQVLIMPIIIAADGFVIRSQLAPIASPAIGLKRTTLSTASFLLTEQFIAISRSIDILIAIRVLITARTWRVLVTRRALKEGQKTQVRAAPMRPAVPDSQEWQWSGCLLQFLNQTNTASRIEQMLANNWIEMVPPASFILSRSQQMWMLSEYANRKIRLDTAIQQIPSLPSTVALARRVAQAAWKARRKRERSMWKYLVKSLESKTFKNKLSRRGQKMSVMDTSINENPMALSLYLVRMEYRPEVPASTRSSESCEIDT